MRSTDSVGCILKTQLDQPFPAGFLPNDLDLRSRDAWNELKRQAQQLADDCSLRNLKIGSTHKDPVRNIGSI